jgi:hypothetical protein
LGAFNGASNAGDGNRGKSLSAWFHHPLPEGAVQVLYFGGPEGNGDHRPWRHLFDGWVQAGVGRVTLVLAGNAGFEVFDLGTRSWQGLQGSIDVEVRDGVTVGVRVDGVSEDTPTGVAGNLSWPTSRLVDVTVGAGWRPTEGLLVRLEARHDQAADPIFFADDPLVPTERTQTTVTIGVTGWFDARIPLPTDP